MRYTDFPTDIIPLSPTDVRPRRGEDSKLTDSVMYVCENTSLADFYLPKCKDSYQIENKNFAQNRLTIR